MTLLDILNIWNEFEKEINQHAYIKSFQWEKKAGIPFIYVTSYETKQKIEETIRKASSRVMRGKRLHSETIYVRESQDMYVYRHRFYVPQEKMFCCGNLCVDCIRLRS